MVLPFIIGTPARQMLSLSAIRLPACLPPALPSICTLTCQALYLFSAPSGRLPGVRGYVTGDRLSDIASAASYNCTPDKAASAYAAISTGVRDNPKSAAIFAN